MNGIKMDLQGDDPVASASWVMGDNSCFATITLYVTNDADHLLSAARVH